MYLRKVTGAKGKDGIGKSAYLHANIWKYKVPGANLKRSRGRPYHTYLPFWIWDYLFWIA